MYQIVLVKSYIRVFRPHIEHKTIIKWLYLVKNSSFAISLRQSLPTIIWHGHQDLYGSGHGQSNCALRKILG
jgi:hypothetical protein